MTRFALHHGSLAGAALVLLLGCQAETFGADDIVVDPATMVLAGTRLPGGIITVTAPGLENASLPLTIVIDGMQGVAATRSSDRTDRFSFRLPSDLTSGPHEMRIWAAGNATSGLATLNVGGFSEVRYLLGSTRSTSQVLPYLPGIVSTDGSGVIVVDARSGTVKRIPAREQIYGLGSTFVANAFVEDDGTAWRRMSLSLGQVRVDTAYLGWSNIPVSHELAPGVVLQAIKGGYSNLNWNILDGYGYPDHVAHSDDGRWSVPDHWRSDSGVLIWDRQLASYAWAPNWKRVRTAFLPDDQLVVVGTREGEPYDYTLPIWLARIDPASRSVKDSVLLDSSIGSYPSVGTTSRGWIVIAWPEGDRWHVSVRDPVTLGEIGRSSVALTADQDPDQDLLVVDDPTYHRWYLVPEYQNLESIAIATFLAPE